MARNPGKQRKTRAQEIADEADNAGRFAGNDADAKAAKEQAMANSRAENSSLTRREGDDTGNTDAEARRDPAQSHDYKGEAQNVNEDSGRPLNEQDVLHARNKAQEGIQQNREGRDGGTTSSRKAGGSSDDIY